MAASPVRPDASLPLPGGDHIDAAEYDDVLPDAHPAFRAAFPGDLYDDEADEFAPFGSDEGWDAMAEIVDGHTPLADDVTLRDLAEEYLDWDAADFEDDDLDSTEESDFVMTGVAFTILRLTGRIDEEGRLWLLAALRRQQTRYGADIAELRQMIGDLEALAG
jgi:uncharacterized protein YfeS